MHLDVPHPAHPASTELLHTEWAVPVKQDRRLSPSFKVRVEVQYSGRMSFPLTLRAFVISQNDKDVVQKWSPEGPMDPDKVSERQGLASKMKLTCEAVLTLQRKMTELKGSTSITHQFEAGSVRKFK